LLIFKLTSFHFSNSFFCVFFHKIRPPWGGTWPIPDISQNFSELGKIPRFGKKGGKVPAGQKKLKEKKNIYNKILNNLISEGFEPEDTLSDIEVSSLYMRPHNLLVKCFAI